MNFVNVFKKKYPRQFKRLIEYYGGRKNIFDVYAAVQMYLRGDPTPKCEICDNPVSITKRFRDTNDNIRCRKHTNTNNIISLEEIHNAETTDYTVVSLPNKVLTRTDVIEVMCSSHGNYKVSLGNFLDGTQCQKCYHKSRIGHTGVVHSAKTKKDLSIMKTGKTINLSAAAKQQKTLNQKKAWESRKEDKVEFEKYRAKASIIRKKYLKENGLTFPNKEKTSLEISFEQFLNDNNIRYVTQHPIREKKFDFYLLDMLLLVEVDGEYWHRKESSIKNDIVKHQICVEEDIRLIRISSDNWCPEIIFESKEIQNKHTKHILNKRGIYEY